MLYQLKRPTDADLRAWATRLRGVPPGDERRRLAGVAALPAAWRTRDRLTSPEWPGLADLDLWRSVGASHALQFFPPSLTTLPADGQPPPYQVAYATGYLTTMQGHFKMTEIATQPPNLVAKSAVKTDLDEQTLGDYLTAPDVSDLGTKAQAQLLVALANHVGIAPLVKPFIVIKDGKTSKIYATAACFDGIRRLHNVELSYPIPPCVVEIGGMQMFKCSALALDPNNGQSETRTAFTPWLKERVVKWGETSKGKRYPVEVEYDARSPVEVANQLMHIETKAARRATKALHPIGAIESRDDAQLSPYTVESYVEAVPEFEAPHADEAGG